MSRELFDQLESGGWPAVQQLVDEQREESERLDFKRFADLNQVEEAVAKAASGFANTEGGLLVVGVSTAGGGRGTPDHATGFALVKDVPRVRQRIDQLAASLTDPPVPGLRVRAIMNDGGSDGVLLVYVPQSDGSPHRAKRGQHTDRYLMRTATSTVVMPHSILAALFGRRPQPRLRLYASRNELRVANEGRGAAEDVFIRVSVLTAPPFGDAAPVPLLKQGSVQSPFEQKVQAPVVDGHQPGAYGLRETRKRIFPGETLVVARYDTPQDVDDIRVEATLYSVDAPPVDVDGVVGPTGRKFQVVPERGRPP